MLLQEQVARLVRCFSPHELWRDHVGRKGARDRARCGAGRRVHRVLRAGTSSRAAPRLSKSACATSCGRLLQGEEGPVESLMPPHPGVDPYSLHLSAFTPRPLPITAAAAAATAPSRTRSQALAVSQPTALTPSARLINRSQEDIEEEERKAARQLMWMIPLTVLLSAYLYKDLCEIATYVQLGCTPSEMPTL